MEPDGLLEKQYFQRTCSTVQGKIIIHDIPCITFLPYKALGWVQLEPKSDCATLRSWLMEHTKESHQFCLCHLAKWCYAWISFHPCWANTPAVHNNRLCTQQTFSTSSGPGSGLKIHMRNFLTSSQQLICWHVQTLWHSTVHLQKKKKKKIILLHFCFRFHYV